MRILVTNDDGVRAAGLWEAVRALQPLGDVMVVAPSGDYSGAGSGILWHQRMAYRPIRPRRKGCEEVPTYIVYNTPAAAVAIGAKWLAKDHIDLVVSGINDGSNVGRDIILSGTVGAAAAGAMLGIPSIAISQSRRQQPTRYAPSKAILPNVAKLALEALEHRGLILNVNAPDCRPEEIRGFSGVQLAHMHVLKRTTFQSEEVDAGGVVNVKAQFGPMSWDDEKGTDIWALARNFVTVALLRPEFVQENESPASRALIERLNQAYGKT